MALQTMAPQQAGTAMSTADPAAFPEAAGTGRTRRPSGWSTPTRFRALTAFVGLASLLFAFVAATTSAGVRSGFDAIGHTDAPQVVASSDLSYSLNDMDANLGNILMVGDKDLGPGISRAAFGQDFQLDLANADHDLELAAARAGTAGPEADQIQRAFDAIGAYQALAAQVMLLDTQHPGRVAGQAPADETALYDKATDLMQQQVLPAAAAVTSSNGAALEAAYQSRHGQAQTAMVWIGVAGSMVAAGLLVLQFELRRKTKRQLNPLLAAATVVAAGLTVWSVAAMSAGAEDLRSAKKDAFDSVSALSAAKALSTDANADETRFIADPARASQYAQAFLTASQQLLDLGPGVTLGTYDASLKTALDTYFSDGADHPVTFGGYLGTEMKNITFPGERQAAEQALRTYQTYELDDRILRQKAAGPDLGDAVRYDTSPAPDASDGAFNAYAAALQQVTKINQDAFDQRVSAGLGELGGWPWIPAGGAVVVAGLAVGGVRPRLAEYR